MKLTVTFTVHGGPGQAIKLQAALEAFVSQAVRSTAITTAAEAGVELAKAISAASAGFEDSSITRAKERK